MNLELVTLTGVKHDAPAYSVTLPTVDGESSVFPGHEPLVTLARAGVISVRASKHTSDADTEFFAISGGVIEVAPTHVRVLVDEADHGEEIVEAHTRAALERAIAMRDEAETQVEREKAHRLVMQQQVRLKVADLHRRKRRR